MFWAFSLVIQVVGWIELDLHYIFCIISLMLNNHMSISKYLLTKAGILNIFLERNSASKEELITGSKLPEVGMGI